MSDQVQHDSETPAHGQQVITACAFIHQNFEGVEKVFLPKRALSKKFLPGVWELPGGHINFGEDIIAGLKREILEEIKMEVNVGDPFAVFTYMNNVKGSQSVEIIYFAKFTGPISEIKLNPEDHSEFGWFSEEETRTRVVNAEKTSDDPEMAAIFKGFGFLKVGRVNFG